MAAEKIGAATRLRAAPAPASTPKAIPQDQAMAVATTISVAVNRNAARKAGPSLIAASATRLGAPKISGLRTPSR